MAFYLVYQMFGDEEDIQGSILKASTHLNVILCLLRVTLLFIVLNVQFIWLCLLK